MKRCWKCAEEIQDAALVCRFCQAQQFNHRPYKPPADWNMTWKHVAIATAVIIVAVLLSKAVQKLGLIDERPQAQALDMADATPPPATPDSAHPSPIDPGVYEPYRRDKGWSKTFAKWGDKGVARIQKLREAAALTASKNPACDGVELSEISDARSTPPNNPVVYVDCTNGERFYLGESDVGGEVSTELAKGARFSSADLIRRCTEEVKARLSLPATFDQSMFSASDRQGTSGNRVINFDFEAKNRLGLTLPARAECIMTTGGHFEVSIIE